MIEERWEASQEPDMKKTTEMMYGSEAFGMMQKFMATADIPPYRAMMHKMPCPSALTWGRDDRVSPPGRGHRCRCG